MKILNLTTCLLILTTFLNSCSNKDNDSGHIEADISKLTTAFDKVVIEKMNFDYTSKKLTFIRDTIDSKNGKFDYYYKVDEPKCMAFYLLQKEKRVGTLSFLDKYSKTESFWGNPYFGNERIKFSIDSKHKTFINKDNKVYRLEFDGSEEADMFMKLNHYKMLTAENIKKHPSNYALLNSLLDKSDSYKVEEIKNLSSLFSEDLKKSKTYGHIKTYVEKELAMQENGVKNNFNWKDISGQNHNFDQVRNGKENVLLVFWASWCGPCRKEIPELKKCYEKYKDELSIVSLSIDNDYNNWKKAVDKEEMPWVNLSGLPLDKSGINIQYNITSVPTMILVDKQGKILKRVVNDLPSIEKILETRSSS